MQATLVVIQLSVPSWEQEARCGRPQDLGPTAWCHKVERNDSYGSDSETGDIANVYMCKRTFRRLKAITAGREMRAHSAA